MDSFVPISRKEFFRAGILVGSGIFLSSCLTKIQHFRKENFLVLSPSHRKTLISFLEVAFPHIHKDPTMIEKVIRRIDEELYFVDEEISESFQDALFFAEWYPLFYWGSPVSLRRFSSLPIQDREWILKDSIENHSGIKRVVFSNIRMVVYYVYYGLEFSWKEIGYDGPFGGFKEKPSEMRAYYREKIS